MCILPFVYSSVHLGCSFLSAIVNHAAVSMGVQTSDGVPAFVSFGYIPRRGFLRHIVILCLSFVINCHIVLHSGCTILHFHQQFTSVLLCLHTYNFLLTKANFFCYIQKGLFSLHSYPTSTKHTILWKLISLEVNLYSPPFVLLNFFYVLAPTIHFSVTLYCLKFFCNFFTCSLCFIVLKYPPY